MLATQNPMPDSKSKQAQLSLIPGDASLPIIGNTLSFLNRPVQFLEEMQKKHGNVFKTRILAKPVIFLVGTEANKFLLVEQAKYMSNQKGWESIDELFHDGLMLRDGENHQHHRGIMLSAFRKEPLRGYMDVMLPKIKEYLFRWQNTSKLTVFPEMKKLTLFLAGKVFFGLDLAKDLEKINKAIIQVVKASTTLLPFKIPFTTYWHGIQGRKVLASYFGKILAERRKNPTEDMLGKLCTAENEEGDKLSDEDIINHLIFLLMAAHDTTASTLTSLFYELAKNPEWQTKLRQESLDFDKNHSLNFDTLSLLQGLDLAIKETLRMHTPLIMIPRRTTERLEFEGHSIPADTDIAVLVHHNHYDTEIFKDAEAFDPDRFADPRSEHKKCPHGYAPFGGGKHHCLGFSFAEMQIKLVMHNVLTQYQWSVPAGYQAVYKHIPIQEPKDGLPIHLSKI